MRLKQRVAVVTGAASGIGRSIAFVFAKEGAKIAIVDVDERAGKDVAKQIKGDAVFLECNVGNSDSVKSMIQQVEEEYGAIDILVNDAGITLDKPVENTSIDEWNRVINVNLTGVFLCSKFAIPIMKERRRGVIVNISSINGLYGGRTRAAYSATKGGIIALTKAMAIDLASFNIRVNCVCPSSTLTPMLTDLIGGSVKALEPLVSLHPLGRIASVEDIAYAALFFASDESAFVTGEVLVVDGGRSCGALFPAHNV